MNKSVSNIFSLLKKEYLKKDILYVEKRKDPFRILVSCIISLRTKEEVTEVASENLFARANSPKKMIILTENKISKLIYPAGFYNRKAAQIKELSKILIKKYNSKVPDNLDTLLKLPGVGRKTANLVLSLGFNKPGICVDTHVHRISNRIGLVKTKTPDQTEFALRKTLPRKYWKLINSLFVKHGRLTCKPISPKCDKCIIEKFCLKFFPRPW